MATGSLNTLTLPAPAKLNLFLHITGRRPDGYHELQTLFVLLDRGDTLHFQSAPELELVAPDTVPTGKDNLVLHAARALRQYAGSDAGARIELDKQLPAGAGLGGGSSDAASTLLGLNALWGLNLDTATLADIGLGLGADVPVFLHGRCAWAEGVGERLTPVTLPEQWFCVIHPGVAVSTGQVFNDPQLTRDNPKSTLAAFLEPGAHATFRNVCEPVARRHFPEIGVALEWLETRAGNSRMTGTGAAVFARINSRQDGETLLADLPPRWTGFIARSVNRSPALEALETLRSQETVGR